MVAMIQNTRCCCLILNKTNWLKFFFSFQAVNQYDQYSRKLYVILKHALHSKTQLFLNIFSRQYVLTNNHLYQRR